ncbi:DEKNAAC103694 [Brettanomyces naardenensis]|uniref:Alpha-1,3/1,6-mannosyltransferase ALG2 n=1 Tax=Brettanomyces naardenensis TaxID=13370 RepID=A0A448YNS5_BRENA|nr:DEKNAAC103694 [Brettanomyces naardenensis]
MSSNSEPLKVAFIHPDLGIGGAERLVVDAALAIKTAPNPSEQLNDITIYTSHCDQDHCFEEVANGEFTLRVYGDFLPTNLAGRFSIVFAFLRQLYLVLKMILSGELRRYDLIFIDQLAYCIPLLHLCKRPDARILFYCHFPDKLLAPHNGTLRSAYRLLFDRLEEWTTGTADKIVVNSQFTRQTVRKNFKSLQNVPLEVVYPCVPSTIELNDSNIQEVSKLVHDSPFFLSINRFERKKHIQLAIQAYARYIEQTRDSIQKLVISGGYDDRLEENKSYLAELEQLCDKLHLKRFTRIGENSEAFPDTAVQVIFLPSISTGLKNALLSKTDMLMYTPSYEHFGIVPLEAMRLGKLVLADCTGGPLETVVNYFDHRETYTGFTVEADQEKWSDILELVKGFSDNEIAQVAERNKQRVENHFSFTAMQKTLCEAIDESEPKVFAYEKSIPLVMAVLAVAAVAVARKSD